MRTTTFESARRGDKVYCIIEGWGEVIGIKRNVNFPILVRFISKNELVYSLDGKSTKCKIQTLFWDELELVAPTKPLTVLVNKMEIPDITFKPSLEEPYYYPVPSIVELVMGGTFIDTSVDHLHRSINNLCYPRTTSGKMAAILHSKAMLGFLE